MFEGDRARQQIDVIIDETAQRVRVDDHFGTEPITHFDDHGVTVGDDRAARQAIGARYAAALDFVAVMRRRHAGGVTGGMDPAQPALCFHPGGCTLVACELGLVEAGLEIAEQRGEFRAFDPHIQLVAAGGIEAPIRAVSEHSVIGARIDRAEQALLVALLGAVVSHRQQGRSQHPAFGVERNAAMITKVAVKAPGALHHVGDRALARSGFDQPDQRPLLVTWHHPGFQRFPALLLVGLNSSNLAALLVVGKGEIELKRSAHQRGRQFNQRDAIVALDCPARREAAQA